MNPSATGATGVAAAKPGLGEIEDGIASPAYLRFHHYFASLGTSIDVLEISRLSQPRLHLKLNQDALKFEDRISLPNDPSLLVLFINVEPVDRGNHVLLANPSSLELLRKTFGLALVFLDCLVDMSWGAKPGNFCHNRYDDGGIVTRTDALYHFIGDNRPCHVWSSHRVTDQTTIYIISNCPMKARLRMLQCAGSSEYQNLLRPMIVDTMIADASSEQLKADIQTLRGTLISYEKHGASQIPSEPLQDSFKTLHELSQKMHILYENLIDLEEALAFIMDLYKTQIGQQNKDKTASEIPNYEAMEFLSSRNQYWKRWVGNYVTRTQIRINLFFNLAAQNDNRTNIQIANNSKQIAEATLHDSSSMIVIATLTMFFLPGTFVSAIFSMTFFSNAADASGKPTLTVLPEWWYFPVATIPLTVLVFVLWRIWQRRREDGKGSIDSNALISPWNLRGQFDRVINLLTKKADVSDLPTSNNIKTD